MSFYSFPQRPPGLDMLITPIIYHSKVYSIIIFGRLLPWAFIHQIRKFKIKSSEKDEARERRGQCLLSFTILKRQCITLISSFPYHAVVYFVSKYYGHNRTLFPFLTEKKRYVLLRFNERKQYTGHVHDLFLFETIHKSCKQQPCTGF